MFKTQYYLRLNIKGSGWDRITFLLHSHQEPGHVLWEEVLGIEENPTQLSQPCWRSWIILPDMDDLRQYLFLPVSRERLPGWGNQQILHWGFKGPRQLDMKHNKYNPYCWKAWPLHKHRTKSKPLILPPLRFTKTSTMTNQPEGMVHLHLLLGLNHLPLFNSGPCLSQWLADQVWSPETK